MYQTTRLIIGSRFSEAVQRYCRSALFASRKHFSTTVTEPESAATVSVIPQGVLGQPTCHTHPHLIKDDHLANGLPQSEFVRRRSNLVKRLCDIITTDRNLKQQIVVIPSASKQYMTEKIPFVFRQNSNFYYLTGCLEQDSLLILTIPPKDNSYKTTLFLRGPDKNSEQWDGPRTGFEDGRKMFAVDNALPFSELKTFFKSHMKSNSNIVWYSADDSIPDMNDRIVNSFKELGSFSMGCPKKALHSMRLIKSPAEIGLMRRSCRIASEAINKAMACTKPGVSEHEIFALLDYECRVAGAEQLAFPPVIAGGTRATAIHYINNTQVLKSGEMLLIDSGCQLSGYNSDISRTWPVSGKFDNYQRILYEIILSLQLRLLKMLKDERPSLDRLFDAMCKQLGKTLQEEGIIPKDKSENEIIVLAYKFCPHHVSHYLGLDVHDSAMIPRQIPIESGMIVTMEPGIYIKSDDTSVRKEFRGVGVRIEDDVLITDSDTQVLTALCHKQVEDIEKVVGTRTLPQ